mmetsp:Transcript_13403/g.11481  ORF Transcript_13403/g.11481 Transcript_13403/m.11481 type:complete len:275 (-) Transcript_13403:663-1487(-)
MYNYKFTYSFSYHGSFHLIFSPFFHTGRLFLSSMLLSLFRSHIKEGLSLSNNSGDLVQRSAQFLIHLIFFRLLKSFIFLLELSQDKWESVTLRCRFHLFFSFGLDSLDQSFNLFSLSFVELLLNGFILFLLLFVSFAIGDLSPQANESMNSLSFIMLLGIGLSGFDSLLDLVDLGFGFLLLAFIELLLETLKSFRLLLVSLAVVDLSPQADKSSDFLFFWVGFLLGLDFLNDLVELFFLLFAELAHSLFQSFFHLGSLLLRNALFLEKQFMVNH